MIILCLAFYLHRASRSRLWIWSPRFVVLTYARTSQQSNTKKKKYKKTKIQTLYRPFPRSPSNLLSGKSLLWLLVLISIWMKTDIYNKTSLVASPWKRSRSELRKGLLFSLEQSQGYLNIKYKNSNVTIAVLNSIWTVATLISTLIFPRRFGSWAVLAYFVSSSNERNFLINGSLIPFDASLKINKQM